MAVHYIQVSKLLNSKTNSYVCETQLTCYCDKTQLHAHVLVSTITTGLRIRKQTDEMSQLQLKPPKVEISVL